MCNHPHVELTRPDGTIDEFDADIAPLAQLLFKRGIIERFSCQGDPFFIDQTRYEARDHRAYIMVENTPEALMFLSDLAGSFPAWRQEAVSWTIEIDQAPLRKFMRPEQHNPKPRITFRFPHQDILNLTMWILNERGRKDIEELLFDLQTSSGADQQAMIDDLLREENK